MPEFKAISKIPVPFTVVGGFLGSGKTTLLNHLLKMSSGVRFAILVNDFGDLNIDVSLIASHEGETISLTNGCICCNMVDGFGHISARMDDPNHFLITPHSTPSKSSPEDFVVSSSKSILLPSNLVLPNF